MRPRPARRRRESYEAEYFFDGNLGPIQEAVQKALLYLYCIIFKKILEIASVKNSSTLFALPCTLPSKEAGCLAH